MFAVIYNPAAELLHVMDLPGQMRPFCVSWSGVRLAHCSGGLMVSPAVVVQPHTCGLLAWITPKLIFISKGWTSNSFIDSTVPFPLLSRSVPMGRQREWLILNDEVWFVRNVCFGVVSRGPPCCCSSHVPSFTQRRICYKMNFFPFFWWWHCFV